MNIYFACSITGGREFEEVYQALTQALLKANHEVPTAHLAEANVMALEKVVKAGDVYTRDVSWIQECDALIAEVSVPSHGVGYEIGFALNVGKPVLCLAQKERSVSKMITGNPHPALVVRYYHDIAESIKFMNEFLETKQSL